MNRLPILVALALAFSAPAFAQNETSDPSADTQAVDTTSSVDRQAMDTYSKNALPPVPAARLSTDRPADMRPKDITGSADRQATETYRKNAQSPVPIARYGSAGADLSGNNSNAVAYRYSKPRKHHRTAHRGHVTGDPSIIDHSADHGIVEPTPTNITVPSDN